jgi:hypothetical protein
MIHRCQILKADLKHCQHLGGDDPTRVPDSKLLMLNFAIPSALTEAFAHRSTRSWGASLRTGRRR